MTKGDIERDLKRFCGDASWCKPGQFTKWIGQKNVQRTCSQLLSGLDTVEGRYLIADVARRMMERRQLWKQA